MYATLVALEVLWISTQCYSCEETYDTFVRILFMHGETGRMLALARLASVYSDILQTAHTSPGVLAHLYGQPRNNCKSFHSSTAHIYDVPITTY